MSGWLRESTTQIVNMRSVHSYGRTYEGEVSPDYRTSAEALGDTIRGLVPIPERLGVPADCVGRILVDARDELVTDGRRGGL